MTASTRPHSVPRRAKARRVMTGIGPVDVWIWPGKTARTWWYHVAGPEPTGNNWLETYHEVLGTAVGVARLRYGKPVRAVSARVRFMVFERDGFRCRYCGRRPPAVELVLDHVVSVDDGGSSDPENLVTACTDCNLGKGNRSVEAP